jgi:hypothetical protein
MELYSKILTGAAFLLSAAGAPAAEYPYLTVTPDRPSPDDSVHVQLILGVKSNTCAPDYDTEYVIERSLLTVYPPQFAVRIEYQEILPPAGQECDDVITEYGPRFAIGKLAAGKYTIMDGEDNVGSFDVAEGYDIRGVVSDDPYPMERMPLPIPGAKVYCKKAPYAIRKSRKSEAGDPIIIIPPMPMQIVDSAFTNESGAFAFDNLPEENYTITVSANDYKARTLNLSLDADTALAIKLLPKGAHAAFSGTVTELLCESIGGEGAVVPLPACSVVVYVNRPSAYYSAPIPRLPVVAVTDDQGRYRIDSIAIDYNAQRATVTARKSGYLAETKSVELRNTETTTADFQLERPYRTADSVTVDGVTFRLACEKSLYEMGDYVQMRYTVTNNSIATVNWNFTSGCQFDVVVSSHGATVYDFEEICTFSPTTITLAPGESEEKTFPEFQLPEDIQAATATAHMIGYEASAVTLNIPIAGPTAADQVLVSAASQKPRMTFVNGVVSVNIGKPQTLTVSVFDPAGRTIQSLGFRKRLGAGAHRFRLNSACMRSGAYILRVSCEQFSETRMIRIGIR